LNPDQFILILSHTFIPGLSVCTQYISGGKETLLFTISLDLKFLDKDIPFFFKVKLEFAVGL
jgi:hypothetical protein